MQAMQQTSLLGQKAFVPATSIRTRRSVRQQRVACAAQKQPLSLEEALPRVGGFLTGLAAAAVVFSAGPAAAAVRLPPLDDYPGRCDRAYDGNTIGQANAVSDKILDLRKCSLKGADLHGKTLSGGLFVESDISNTNLIEAVLSKAYAVKANFSGADFTNAVVDRVAFDQTDLSGATFTNAVITGTTFEGANMAGATFEDALIGGEDVKRMCLNDTLQGEGRLQVGCRAVKAKPVR